MFQKQKRIKTIIDINKMYITKGEYIMNDEVEKYVNMLAKANKEVDDITEEIKKLTALKKQKAEYARQLNANLTKSLDDQKILGFATSNYKVSVVSYRPRVIIDDEKNLDPKFIKTRITKTPDKNAIYKAINDNQIVPGCHLEENRKVKLTAVEVAQ